MLARPRLLLSLAISVAAFMAYYRGGDEQQKAFLLPLVEPCDGPQEHDEAAERLCSYGGGKKPKAFLLA